jgi:hypothetical protein
MAHHSCLKLSEGLTIRTEVLYWFLPEHAFYLEAVMTRRVRVRTLVIPRARACPDCGGPLVHAEGCVTCPICGFSACS